MSQTFRSARISRIAGKNLIFIGAILLIILGFYYYRIQNAGTSPALSEQSAELSAVLTPSSEAAAQQLNPLDRLITEIDAGYFNTPRYSTSQTFQLSNSIEGQPAVEEFRPAVKWDMLVSKNYVDSLVSSKARAQEMLPGLGESQFSTRAALVAFIKGVDFVLGRPEQVMTAADGFAYIDHLLARVAESMGEDGIDRYQRRSWERLDERVKQTAREVVANYTAAAKQGEGKTRVELLDVAVKPGSTTVSVNGLIRGMEVDKVQVYWNGAYYASAQLRVVSNEVTPFHFQANDGRGEYSVKVIDKNGHSLTRQYRFFGAE